jgi:hypothetical protein
MYMQADLKNIISIAEKYKDIYSIEDFKLLHSKQRTLRIAKQYKGTRFYKEFQNEYTHAFRNGYIQELRKIVMKMTLKYRKAYIRARKKSILKCATKYQGKNFGKDYSNEYKFAKNKGFLLELKEILKHKYGAEYLKHAALVLASNYKGTRFSVDHYKQYRHAKLKGYLQQLFDILERREEYKSMKASAEEKRRLKQFIKESIKRRLK